MLRSNFDNEIIELSNNLEDIWDSIIKKYEIIFDTLTEVQKQSIVDNDLVINEAVVEIDMKGIELICLQHPVSSDLRKIIAIVKLSTDIERIGDRIVEIVIVLKNVHAMHEWGALFYELLKIHFELGEYLKRALLWFKKRNYESDVYDYNKKCKLISGLCQKLGDKVVENFLIESSNVDEVIVFLEVINILDKISHTTQSIYKWLDYQERGVL